MCDHYSSAALQSNRTTITLGLYVPGSYFLTCGVCHQYLYSRTIKEPQVIKIISFIRRLKIARPLAPRGPMDKWELKLT